MCPRHLSGRAIGIVKIRGVKLGGRDAGGKGLRRGGEGREEEKYGKRAKEESFSAAGRSVWKFLSDYLRDPDVGRDTF